jgi:hypothetical protein
MTIEEEIKDLEVKLQSLKKQYEIDSHEQAKKLLVGMSKTQLTAIINRASFLLTLREQGG